jgi:2',3'-cyclic-nucleotide 2'-phosphodiesterase (5'-nucleotidase family)
MRFKYLFIVIFQGAGLMACSSVDAVYVQTDLEVVSTNLAPDEEIENLIKPYMNKLSKEMDEVIGYASHDLLNNRPEGSLGNFVVDATLDYLENHEIIPSNQYICLMNTGGLRSPIAMGDITVGDIYKLMPFDNTIVVSKLPMSSFDSICNYLQRSGGEPISGFSLNGEVCSLSNSVNADTLFAVTSDYLFNGGDRMTFFESHYSVENTGILLRDLLIDYVKESDTIRATLGGRITLQQ